MDLMDVVHLYLAIGLFVSLPASVAVVLAVRAGEEDTNWLDVAVTVLIAVPVFTLFWPGFVLAIIEWLRSGV